MSQEIFIDENNNALFIRKDCLKSKSFNRTVILNEKSKEIISKLILEKANSIEKYEYWRFDEIDELTKTALNLGLTEVADEIIQFT